MTCHLLKGICLQNPALGKLTNVFTSVDKLQQRAINNQTIDTELEEPRGLFVMPWSHTENYLIIPTNDVEYNAENFCLIRTDERNFKIADLTLYPPKGVEDIDVLWQYSILQESLDKSKVYYLAGPNHLSIVQEIRFDIAWMRKWIVADKSIDLYRATKVGNNWNLFINKKLPKDVQNGIKQFYQS